MINDIVSDAYEFSLLQRGFPYPEITVQTDVMSRKAGHSRYTEIEIITMVILMLCNVITIIIFTEIHS